MCKNIPVDKGICNVLNGFVQKREERYPQVLLKHSFVTAMFKAQ